MDKNKKRDKELLTTNRTFGSHTKQHEKKSERKIGILDGKAKIKFTDDFKMTTEELCDIVNC